MRTEGRQPRETQTCAEMTEERPWATLVARHELLRSVQRWALRLAEHLFQTFHHQAFTTGH
jgi:hypothetical protein